MLGLLGPPSLLSFWIRRLDSTKADEPEGGDLVNSGTSGGGIDSETGGFVGTTATSWTLVAFGAGEFVGLVFFLSFDASSPVARFRFVARDDFEKTVCVDKSSSSRTT